MGGAYPCGGSGSGRGIPMWWEGQWEGHTHVMGVAVGRSLIEKQDTADYLSHFVSLHSPLTANLQIILLGSM